MELKLKRIFAVGLILASVISCKKDDPEEIHEHEVFSNVKLTLTPDNGGQAVEFHWHDEDGDLVVDEGEIENGSLATSTTYNAVISFNKEEHEEHEEGEEEEHDLDAEILKEATEHQLFFTDVAVAGLTVTYADTDENENPLGIKTTFVTEATFKGGELTVTLRHEPTKDATGVADGDITNAGGTTDAEVTFDLGVVSNRLVRLK